MALFRNRITELLGVEIPIVQAPMGWIARAQLASAVSNAGAMGIIETSSGELDAVKGEIRKMRDLTDKPFGVNIAQAFVRDPKIVDFVIEQGVQFVTTSAGSPTQYTPQLKAAGLTVFHVVPNLRGALKAIDAGVDGLVVEGGEGGGFKNPRDVATMAAAFALGAEGVQMGTRMVSSLESPVHEKWKQAVVDAAETDTVFLNRRVGPGLRALRTKHSESLEDATHNVMAEFGDRAKVLSLYFGGDLEASIALSGQVAGRIDAVRPVAEIVRECAVECLAVLARLAERYPEPV
jgi:enoyl-[acyl-carrier protein] reductase II